MSKKRLLSRAEVDVDVWEERDRLSIVIKDKKTGQRTIAEWWDDDARQMFEDGFFKRGVELKRSVIGYAEDMGLLSKVGRNPGGAVRKNVFLFNNPGNAQRILAENFVKGANSGVASSLYIHGNRIYSYGPHFPIAQRNDDGTILIRHPSKKAPSKTTAGHISLVVNAARQVFSPDSILYDTAGELSAEAKGPAAFSNPGKVRKNVFLFNNPPRGSKRMGTYEVFVGNIGLVYEGDDQKKAEGTYNEYVRLSKMPGSRASGESVSYLCEGELFREHTGRRPQRINNNPHALFSNPRDLNMVEKAAAEVGLVIGTWAPGDGVTRYRFFLKSGTSRYGDYHQGDGLYTALGRKDAMAFISAYGKGRSARTNPRGSAAPVYVIEGFTHQGRRGHTQRRAEFRTPSLEAARARAEQIFQETGVVVAITQRNPLTKRETSTVVDSARFHARMARSVTPGAPYRSHLLGVAEGQLNVAAQYGRGKNRGRAGTMVSAVDRMAMAKGGPYMRFSHKPIRRNPAVCPNPCVRGDKLPYHLQQEVLRKYIYRWTTGNTQRESAWGGITGKPTMPLITDAQWLREHAFHVTKAGKLNLNHHHAEPYYMADDWKKGDPLPNPLLQTIMLANPPISRQWDRLTGRQRLQLLGFVGFEETASRYLRLPWKMLSDMVKQALEQYWNDSSSSRGTTRRRMAPVGANPLNRKESGRILREANKDVKDSYIFQRGHTRSVSAGISLGKAAVVARFGPHGARRPAKKVMERAATAIQSNPGSLRLPKPGTKMTVSAALELARKIGDRGLIQQCQKALKLQKAANKNAKCVIWKTFPMGSSDKIDSVVALTHYGDSPETMYQPPKGSKKGNHMYRHKWGETGGKRSVPLLASADGKMLLMPLEGKKIASDWLRH